MADFNASPAVGGYDAHPPQNDGSTAGRNRLAALTNFAGAAVSLVLVVGVAVWGYKLLMRDVSDIPIVRAALGEMRERPTEPGGQLAQHQGLSVNSVAAEGTAAAPADALKLAPKPVDLEDDDQPGQVAVVATKPQVEPQSEQPPAPQVVMAESTQTVDVAAALQSGDVNDLVAQLTQGVDPMAGAPEEVVPVVATAAALPKAQNALLDAPGVRQSLRPKHRPAAPARITDAVATSAPAPAVDPAALPAGTRLAQLGAFDSPEVAQAQWVQLSTRFDAYLDGKSYVIQKATSGGRVFYRLRAMGFDDLADARRFCSALVAQNTDCIPVVTR